MVKLGKSCAIRWFYTWRFQKLFLSFLRYLEILRTFLWIHFNAILHHIKKTKLANFPDGAAPFVNNKKYFRLGFLKLYNCVYGTVCFF